MPKKQLDRQCKDCQNTFPYIPRRIPENLFKIYIYV